MPLAMTSISFRIEQRDQAANSGARGEHAGEVIASLLAELGRARRLQAIAEGLDLAQWFLQIVRGDRGELLEFAIAALKRLIRLRQRGRAAGDALFQFIIRGGQRLGPVRPGLQLALCQQEAQQDQAQA